MMRRPALVERVAEDPPALTLLVAPSGCGKSELLAQLVEALDGAVAWLTVDPYDDDPTRFWAYLLAAIEPAVSGSLDELRERLRAPQVPLATGIVEPILGLLGTTPVTIVIDDYHLITNDSIHDSLQHLIRHLPESAHLVLASRTQPPFVLGRSRVRREVLEIRAAALALTPEEAKELLQATAGIDVPDGAVAAIHGRTEGWAAGLYLAGLSLRKAEDVDEFAQHFAGDDRNVAEYLATEVIAVLDADTQTFLREASVLDELTGPLCDHVLERAGSAARLRELALENMLLIPTDMRNESFRFHHIFRDWLQLELELATPGRAQELHARAMEWYATRDTRLAGHHAVRSGDPDLAVNALVQWGTDLIDHGELATVTRWASAVPEDRFARDPSLAVMLGWMSIGAGRVDELEPWLVLADQAHANGENWRSGMGPGDTLCLRAYRAMLAGDVEAAAEYADRALERVTWVRTGVAANLHRGIAGYWLGDDRAAAWLEEAARGAAAHPEPYAGIQAAAFLALIERDQDRHDSAGRLVEEARRITDDFGLREFGQTAVAHLATATLALDSGELDDALAAFDRAGELAERIHSRPIILAALLGRADASQVAGDRDAALGLLDRAVEELAQMPSPGTLVDRVAVVERRVRGRGQQVSRPSLRPAVVEELTERELAVLRLLPGRLTQREIGEALHLSMNTVKTHTRNIFRKLSASSRDEAVEIARSIGLI